MCQKRASLAFVLTHLLLISNMRPCDSFLGTSSSQKTIGHNSFLTMRLFSMEATKKDSDDEQDEDGWEWDGVPVEGAHDAEFEDGSGSNDEFFVSANFMSMATSVTSPVLTAIGTSSSSSNFDQSKNAGKLHLMEDDDFDLEAIGGDSGFLDEEEFEMETEFGKIKISKAMDDDSFWEVDEDAHFD